MENKRKACYLLIMLLVDSFNIGMPHTIPARVARDIDATSADSSTALEDDDPEVLELVEYIMSSSTDVAQAGEIMDQLEQLLSSSADTAKSFIIETLKTALIESEVVSLESNATVPCGELSENYATEIHEDVPGSSEMEEFSLLLVYVASDCVVQSSEILDNLVSRFSGPDELLEVLLEFIDGLQDPDIESFTENHDSRLKRSTDVLSDINSPIRVQEVLSSQFRVMESLLFETAQKPKLCKWTLLNADDCYLVPGDAPPYTTLSEAQRACERLHGACSGVSGNETFVLVESCSNAQPIENQTYYNDLYWQKDCESLLGSTAPLVARVKRAYESGSVTLYEHSEYSGRTKDFAPTDSLVNFVGDDFNDIVSSLECRPKHCSVIMFEHRDFTGFQKAYQDKTSYVGSEYNDSFSSLVLLPFSLSALCFEIYSSNAYSGAPVKVCGDTVFSSTRTVKSLKLLCNECSVIVYKGKYGGAFTTFISDVSTMDEEWVEVQSVQVRPWDYGTYQGHIDIPATFYQHKNYDGSSEVLRGKVDYVGNAMNDVYSSFKCIGKCNVLAFEHRDMEGDSILYQSSQSYLSKQNDVISSVFIIPYAVCVTVYEHHYFKGDSLQFCSDAFNLANTILQDEISSLSVDCDHCSVIVYEHANYQGNYKSFRGKISYVGESWNDIISSIQIRPWKLDIEEKTSEVSISISQDTRCQADPEEQKAYNIIQYIPILSFFYSLGSSIYYGATGCDSVAKSRATDMAVDLAMDVGMAIVTVVTGGTATAGVYGAKTAMKAGFKAGLKAFGKASVAIAKSTVKNGIKKGLKLATKKSLKMSLKNSVHAIKAVAKIPKKIGKGLINIGKHVQKNGLKESLENAGRKFTKSVRKSLDQRYQKAAEAVQNAKTSGHIPIKSRSGHIRCKRQPGGACSGLTETVQNTAAYNQAKNRYVGQMSNTRTGKDLSVRYDELYHNVRSPPMDKAEYISLSRYTKEKGHFSEVNRRLRGGSFTDEDLVLQNLLVKSPKVGSNTKLLRFEENWPGSEAFYKANGACTFDSFLSTSKNLRLQKSNIPKSYQWERYYRIEIAKPQKGVEVGKLIKPEGLDKNQAEVLFPARSTFKVKSVSDWLTDKTGKQYKVIKLEQ